MDVEALYEQTKRVLRGTLDERLTGDTPFVMACHDCGLAFPLDVEIGMAAQHAETAHGWQDGESPLPLDLVYIGEGEPPEAAP